MLLYSDIVGQTNISGSFQWALFLQTVKDSSLQLINVIDSCAILAGDSHADPLLRGKTWVDPTVGRRGRAVARLGEFCRSGKSFTAGFGSDCTHRSESSPPAFVFVWPQGRDFPFSSVCSSTSSIPHMQLGRDDLHSQDSKIKSPCKGFYSAQTTPYA